MKPFRRIPDLRPEEIEDFWSNVDQTGGPDACWYWQGDCTPTGNGVMQISRCGKDYSWGAHRIAYALGRKEDPGQHFVGHRCSNSTCCNPAHLFLGTRSDIAKVRDAHGHGLRGRPRKKVTEEIVRQIRAEKPSTCHITLAQKYRLAYGTICAIRNGHTWKNVV